MNLVKHLDEKDGTNQILLEGMVQLAKKLGIHTLVEGMETEEQLEFVKKIGCELVQGFYYHKPDSLKDILKYVELNGITDECETEEERNEFKKKWLEE
jgi:EAL domain-containing protein (putative c-di-GMP-specific phosphodiesterase class I)